MKSLLSRALALGGVIAPILFVGVSWTCASMRPGYSHLHNFISELGANGTSNSELMNYLGFMSSGLLFCLFGIGLFRAVPRKNLARTGTVLIMVFGTGMALAGIYSCDSGCPTDGTLESTIHDRVSAITFISAIIGAIVLGFSFKKAESFKRIANFSISIGFISALLLVVMIDSFESRTYTGLWQRLLLFSIFLWTSIVGIKILKLYKV
ncbi:DUF998 domain-containing protein [Pricia sp.]|uniref:DUF998 domain-containing protein n=1 Tax=Pricia sp. TaxID=2268138 RepID=UPI0035947F55